MPLARIKVNNVVALSKITRFPKSRRSIVFFADDEQHGDPIIPFILRCGGDSFHACFFRQKKIRTDASLDILYRL
jgi:hypothetical protein